MRLSLILQVRIFLCTPPFLIDAVTTKVGDFLTLAKRPMPDLFLRLIKLGVFSHPCFFVFTIELKDGYKFSSVHEGNTGVSE